MQRLPSALDVVQTCRDIADDPTATSTRPFCCDAVHSPGSKIVLDFHEGGSRPGVSPMRRREFIRLFGSTVVVWPLTARAQQPGKVWRIGFVSGSARPVPLENGSVGGFLEGMRHLGYVEGRDFIIEWRFAEGRYELIPDFATEFARLRVDVIVTLFSPAVPPMRQANPRIPIILAYSTDPVGQGLVASLNRPGGTVTGLASALDEIMAKQVDLLMTVVPKLTRVACLTNPTDSANQIVFKNVEVAAQQAQIKVQLAKAQNAQDIGSAFDLVRNDRVDAIIVSVDAFFFANRGRIAELALANRLPSMFGNREYAEAGGLMSYGDSLRDFARRAATFVDKIFKGAKPSDLPIERPTKFDFAINAKTAKALGLTVPPTLLALADEVIE
jgi:putative tryptophan/tyrosine transport system substrate-binding protein